MCSDVGNTINDIYRNPCNYIIMYILHYILSKIAIPPMNGNNWDQLHDSQSYGCTC